MNNEGSRRIMDARIRGRLGGMIRVGAIAAMMALAGPSAARADEADDLRVGFGKADITPDVHARPVWIAGYGNNRQATGVHDPLWARAVVLAHGDEKIALVSVDLIGVQYPLTRSVRATLNDYRYVLISSTHNHEGPDVIGLWGPSQGVTGVDKAYLKQVEDGIVASVRAAEGALAAAKAEYGTAEGGELMRDSRLPEVKDGVLRVLKFTGVEDGKPLGILVQWNCHPESLGSKNTEITADFPDATIRALEAAHGCPVAYFTGAVGGLMSNPRTFTAADGTTYEDENFTYAEAYGRAKAAVAEEALSDLKPIRLAPFVVSAKVVAIPLANPGYRQLRALGVLEREAVAWTGDPWTPGERIADGQAEGEIALVTEVAYLRLGDLHLAGIPGEIYPELVVGRYQEPVEPNVDFPDAPLEPSVMALLPGEKVLIFGLANDEVGYILPKRQWDSRPPYAYGKEKGQYGEVNSVGPETGPILMEALRRAVEDAR